MDHKKQSVKNQQQGIELLKEGHLRSWAIRRIWWLLILMSKKQSRDPSQNTRLSKNLGGVFTFSSSLTAFSLSLPPSQLHFLPLSLCSVVDILFLWPVSLPFIPLFLSFLPPSPLPLICCLSQCPYPFNCSFTHLPFILFFPSPILDSPTTHHIKITYFS